MTKKEIRIQYSGLIIFVAKLLSISTGMIFTLLITRFTTTEQYGLWSNIFDLTTYFVVLAGAMPFWATRFVARGKEGAVKTSFFANLLIALISAAFYIPLVPVLTATLHIEEAYLMLYFLASAHIIGTYLISVLEACLRAKNPQAIGYGLLLEEVCKVTVAYILIVVFAQPLFGALISLIMAILIQILYYLKLVGRDFEQKIQWSYIKEWIKGSVATIYNLIGNQVANFILILLFVYGSEAARGYFQAAFTIGNIVTYSFFLSFALYPKVLAENSLKDVTDSLKLVLMFAIPMAFAAMAMPDSFLVILDEQYRAATITLAILAMDGLLITVSQFYTYVFFGVEKIDEEAKIPLRRLAKSDLFKVFTLPYIHSLITLPTAFYVLSNFALNQPVEAATYVAIINMTARFAMFLVLLIIMRKTVKIHVPWKNIAKYVLAALAMATILYVIPHPTKISSTLSVTIAGGLLYLTLLAIIDKEARMLAVAIMQEAKRKIKNVFTRHS